jgi:S-adenosylmethionine hydrolase
MTTVITLLTDFGLQDIYVGAMKGAIATINSSLKIIDLTHQIPHQNILAGRFCLMNAYSYFPQGTVHLAIVDPGVGSQRRGIAIQFRDGYLVGPDNGLFSGILELSPALAAVHLTYSQYWRTSHPSSTFHGRDIFAPVAAHLASGLPLKDLGELINPAHLVRLSPPSFEKTSTMIRGYIQYIDGFGNLITNIPSAVMNALSDWQLIIKGAVIPSGQTYSDVSLGEAVALLGSHGWLEIAVRDGNAQTQLHLDWGEPIQLLYEEK